jgi:4-amino-4-deoxy-L-arabinose transferase-like glycosyltransferase
MAGFEWSERTRQSVWFWLAWLLLCWSLGVYDYLQLPPQGMHQSAQCDRASLAWNFAYTDGDILHPRIHEVRFGDGIVAGEMPVMPWLTSRLYKVFGFNDAWFRILNFLVYSLGIWCAFLITGFFINKLLHRFLLMAIWCLSPLLFFYAPGFIPDTAAFGFSLIAWYFLIAWWFRKSGPGLYLAGIFFLCLAGLIKVTFAAGLLPAILLPYLGAFFRQKPWLSRLGYALPVAVAVLAIGTWYRYAAALNKHYGNPHFLLNIKPAKDWDNARELFHSTFTNWLENLYPGWFLPIVALAGLAVLYYRRRSEPLLWLPAFLYSGAALGIYGLLQFQFLYHDYYFIFYFLPLFFLLILIYLRTVRFAERRGLFGWLVLILLLFLPVRHYSNTAHYLDERYRPGSYWNQTLTDAGTWPGAGKWLDEAGVPRGNPGLLTGYDETPNNQLYFLERRGYRFFSDYSPETVWKIMQQHSVQWLVLTDAEEWDRRYANDSLFTTRKVSQRKYLSLRKVEWR